MTAVPTVPTSAASFTRLAHLALVVRDMCTSVERYQQVLGFDVISTVRPGSIAAAHPRRLLRHPASALVLAVHEPLHSSNDLFDPSHIGLDHVSLAVADRTWLDLWLRRLTELGVAHSPIRDAGYAEFLTLANPDHIGWELCVSKSA